MATNLLGLQIEIYNLLQTRSLGISYQRKGRAHSSVGIQQDAIGETNGRDRQVKS